MLRFAFFSLACVSVNNTSESYHSYNASEYHLLRVVNFSLFEMLRRCVCVYVCICVCVCVTCKVREYVTDERMYVCMYVRRHEEKDEVTNSRARSSSLLSRLWIENVSLYFGKSTMSSAWMSGTHKTGRRASASSPSPASVRPSVAPGLRAHSRGGEAVVLGRAAISRP